MNAYLVTTVERRTLFTVPARVDSKSAKDVTQATIDLLRPYKSLVHTITADNGEEFAYHERLAKELGAKVYFAHPYCSWERGLNENTNDLLRRYWPKSTDFKTVSPESVEVHVNQLNERPRKRSGMRRRRDWLSAQWQGIKRNGKQLRGYALQS